jgi:crotonobetainyl-CoA:carnitine CoA-transferase CaiB-like acyl-CoA transferase
LPDSSHPTLYPSQLFRTADSYLVIMCAKEKFWRALAEEMGSPEWAEDERFRTFADRFAHRDELIPLLKERFATRTTAWWLERLRGKVPVAPVNSVEEALADEHVRERGMVIEVDHPTFGEMRQTASAISYNGSRGEHRAAPPFGADTEAILRDYLDATPDDLARWHRDGVIRLGGD